MVALYARLFQKTFALPILRICNKKHPAEHKHFDLEKKGCREFFHNVKGYFETRLAIWSKLKTKAFTLKGRIKNVVSSILPAHGHGNWEAFWATHHGWMIFCLNIRIVLYWEWNTNQPTNDQQAVLGSSKDQNLNSGFRTKPEVGHANGPLAKWRQVYVFEHTLQGKMTGKQNGHDSCHISCFFPICKDAVTSLSGSFQNLFPPQNLPTPLPSSCVAWIQIIPWNPMKRTVWSFLQPTFWVWDLSPSSTFSMCKGSWRDRFCSTGTKSHDYMQSTWLTKSTLLSKSSVWLVMFDFSQPPSPAHLLDDFFLRQENIRT